MLIFSKIKFLIIFIFCYLLQNINLTNYISFELIEVDDCVRYINISNQIVFNYTPTPSSYICDKTFVNRSHCDPGNRTMLPADNFIIKNQEYEPPAEISVTFEDWNHLNGYMTMIVYFNEYIINFTDQTFWECKNCINDKGEIDKFDLGKVDIWRNGVKYTEDVFLFHPDGENECSTLLYTFTFRIDDIKDLYKGGKNGPFKKTTSPSDFYTFPEEQIIIEKNVSYSKGDIELELINFNLEDFISAKSNHSMIFKNNDFIYKIKYENIEGKFKGLDSNNILENDLSSGDSFKCTETSGLNYTLGNIEKQSNFTEVKIKISVFNNCPEDTTVYQFCERNAIIGEKEFIFKINIFPPPKIIECLDKDLSLDNKNDDYSSHLCPNYTKNNILDNLEDIVNQIDENKTYQIIGENITIGVMPIDYLDVNNTNKNKEIFSSSTNFTECEKILREYYKIESPRKITFIQVELNNTNDDILINQIEYQVYDDKKNQLNLSLCNSSNLTVYHLLKNDKQEEVDLISFFQKNGINILDLNDNFFNDVCLPYSDLENDLTLNDRIKDLYKNYTFCEKNCKLVNINFEENKAICNCSIKENMNASNFNFESLNIQTEKKNNNFKIIKCHNGFTSIKDNLANLGFWIFLGLMLLNILLLILHFCGLKTINNYISKEMASHGYIPQSGESHVFCHNYILKLERLIEKLNKMKNDFIKKKEPPKKKSKKGSNINTDRRDLIISKKSKPTNSKENLSKKIELLKGRMNKTKKVKNLSNTKDVMITNKVGFNNFSKTEKNNNNFKLNLINIDVNDVKKKTYIPNISGQILNIYNFNEAIKYDKRSIIIIYYIFLIAKQVIMHAFFYRSPLEPLYIRLSLLKFMLGCDLALNAIFYTDDKVSEKYNSSKSAITFAFTNNLIVILLSTLIGYAMFILLANLNNSTNQIRNLFKEEEEKIKNNKNYMVSLQRKKEIICEVKRIMKNYKIKLIIFYIIEFSCMIFFWYYVTIFCNIYKKTQLSWLIDSLLTIIIRILIDLLLNFILALLYKLSICLKNNCLYRTMIFLYCFS